jgi:hypothetical protein
VDMKMEQLRKISLAIAVTVSTGLMPLPALATTVRSVTVEDLTRRADVVLVATPRQTQSLWVGRFIYTDIELDVRMVIRGVERPSSPVVLRLPGGVVRETRQWIPGVSYPEINREYLLFLSRASDVPGVYYTAHLTAAVLPLFSNRGAPAVVGVPKQGLVTSSDSHNTTAASGHATVMNHGGTPLDAVIHALRSVP